jgi:hypothetical protein
MDRFGKYLEVFMAAFMFGASVEWLKLAGRPCSA